MSNYIDIGSAAYPDAFHMIKNKPERLYYRGDLSLLSTRCVAVVGSRRCTGYGRAVARAIGRRAGETGVTLVSGMAEGIDAAAHQGALSVGGKTIAVLGCGVDICYPAGNKTLYKTIYQRGLLLSEYPDGSKPAFYHFPERNRLISGLSEAVVIVEAGTKRSGSLITAEFAAEQGKLLYAVPGNITSQSCFGSNALIRDEGAKPLIAIDDLFLDLGIRPGIRSEKDLELGEDEKRIFDLICSRSEMSTDELCAAACLPPEKVNGIITVLEMKGAVMSAMGKVFVNNI
ncbi:MAG: DNA-processing protein DprA [Lachnospiraceae bacterium]|nr:DNA-processing protein DprA [Lachnospiraceae bacterium]